MYTLLAGSPPFWHRKQMLMLRMIVDGKYQFGSPEWDDYSDTVKDLVRGHAHQLPNTGSIPQSGGISRREPSVFVSLLLKNKKQNKTKKTLKKNLAKAT